jgi:hypothetical protein
MPANAANREVFNIGAGKTLKLEQTGAGRVSGGLEIRVTNPDGGVDATVQLQDCDTIDGSFVNNGSAVVAVSRGEKLISSETVARFFQLVCTGARVQVEISSTGGASDFTVFP